MAGLLVAIAIMGAVMSMVMPAWRTIAKREKEAELVFRGEQYMRAIELYQRRFPGAYPTDLDTLVEQRFLRKVYDDPVTGESFEILRQGTVGIAPGQAEAVPGLPGVFQPGAATATRGGGTDGSPTPFNPAATGLNGGGGSPRSPFTSAAGGLNEGAGGIIGVVSRSTDDSLLEYNGRTQYNEWLFAYLPQAAQPGLGGLPGGVGVPGVGGGTFPGIGGVGGAGTTSGVGGVGGFTVPPGTEPPGPEGRRPDQRPQRPGVRGPTTDGPGGGAPPDGPGVGRPRRGGARPR